MDREHLITSEMNRMEVMNLIETLPFLELLECFQVYGRIKDTKRSDDGTRSKTEDYEKAQSSLFRKTIPV
jgi:hypothetical protein